MAAKIQKANVQDIFELSMVQKGMLYHYLREQNSALYNVQIALSISGNLDVVTLQEALSVVQSKNEVLRSVLRWEEVSNPIQIVLKTCEVSWDVLDLSQSLDYNYDVEQYLSEDQFERFDLSELPFRATLIRQTNEQHTLVITHHHILYDGWSTGILLKELFENYELLSDKREVKNGSKPLYKEFYRTLKAKSNQAVEQKYWQEQLHDYELNSVFTKNYTPEVIQNKMLKEKFSKSGEKLNSFISQHKITKAALLYTAFGVLLQKYNNVDDIVFGTTVSNRNIELHGKDEVMGNFINTIPFRCKTNPTDTLLDVVKQVNSRLIKNLDNNHMSYFEIKDALELQNADHLFDSLIVIENYPLDELVKGGENLDVSLRSVNENASFPLAFTIFPNDELELEVIYKEGFLSDNQPAQLAQHFFKILDEIIYKPSQQLSEISLLTDIEKQQLLVDFNDSVKLYPESDTIISLFEKQAQSTPDATALIFGTERVSFGDLNKYANAVAAKIAEKNIAYQNKIGLLFKPSVETIASMLGVMKAGCVYVPLSPDAPLERNQYIIEDCNASLLLTSAELIKDVKSSKLADSVTCVEISKDHLDLREVETLGYVVTPDDLMYVIYTSGTTGIPKGVEVFHRGLVNYTTWRMDDFKFTPEDVTLQLVSYYFDGYGANLYSALLSGGSLVLMTENERLNPQKIAETIRAEKVSYVGLTPTIFDIVLSELSDSSEEQSLRLVVVAGEKAHPDLLEKSAQILPDTVLCNEYGPTETSIGATFNFGLNHNNTSLIGKPIYNTSIYILDRNDQLLPVGVNGELCIGGVGVAKGYINNEDLTNRKFIPNPFKQGERIYKTGDLACWMPDGNVKFLGRIDNQIKIRGYRIELEEIEHQLIIHDKINEAAVVVTESSADKFLVAYFTLSTPCGSTEIRQYLAQKLPEYMVPSYFVQLDKMPLSANGKLDKKSLPEPQLKMESAYITPRSEEEILLSEVWSKVLDVNSVGVNDNFFMIGGDSIKSIQISSRMRSAGYEVTVKDIFNHPTIGELATKIKKSVITSDQSIVKGESTLTPIQNWFFDHVRTDQHHFNQSIIVEFDHRVSTEIVNTIFDEIWKHHDALRMTVSFDDEKKQINKGLEEHLSVHEFDVSNAFDPQEVINAKGKELQSSFDLENGPLIRLGLFHSINDSKLLVTIHHMVVDGISWRILIEDINTLYHQCINYEPLGLPLKSDAFITWAAQLESYTKSANFRNSVSYWKNVACQEVSFIKTNNPGNNLVKDHQIQSFKLNKELTTKLLTSSHKAFNTQINDLLLSALLLSVRGKCGYENIKIDLEGHGRESLNDTMNYGRTVGWFTSMYPIVLNYESEALSSTIKNVKENLRKVPNNGIDYLLIKQRYQSEKEFADEQPAQISFNYLGQYGEKKDQTGFIVTDKLQASDVSENITSVYNWSISGQVSNGELQMHLRYSKKQYEKDFIADLMQSYCEQLEAIINYCAGCETNDITPSDLTYKALTIAEVNSLQSKYPLQDVYTLSPMQEGMLFHYMMDKDSDQYFEQKYLKLRGSIDPHVVEKSLYDLVQRFDVLRTLFIPEGFKQPLQVVLKERKPSFDYIDIRDEVTDNNYPEVVSHYLSQDRAKKFDLEKDALLRVTLLRVGETAFEFIWSQHHVIMDGWCSNLLWNDFKLIYQHYIDDSEILLQPATPYATYIAWLDNLDHEKSLDYWQEYLAGYESLASIPQKQLVETNKGFILQNITLDIDQERTERLNKLTRQHGVTLSSIFQGIWSLLLSSYNDTSDVVFGTVVSGRPSHIHGVESIVGLFINTIPVRVNVDRDINLSDFLKTIQKNALESELYHHNVLSDVQNRTALGSNLLDHIMIFENFPISEKIEGVMPDKLEEGGFEVLGVEAFEQTNYDLSILVLPGHEVKVKFDYNANKYDSLTIENVSKHFLKIVDDVLSGDQINLADIDILNEEERYQLLHQFNDTSADYPHEKTIVDLFKTQVNKTPEKLAVSSATSLYTYQQLDEKSDAIAAYFIQKLGVKNGDLIGLMLERDEYLIPTIYGILKAGAVYVPIDPHFPAARVNTIIEDSGLKFLVTKSEHVHNHNLEEALIIDLNNIWNELVTLVAPIEVALKSTDLAYVIYTSGSTGKPKGVMIEHHSVINRILWMQSKYPLSDEDVILQKTPIVFDVSIWELFWWSFTGASLHLLEVGGEKEPAKIVKAIEKNGVTTMHFVPSMLAVFLSTIKQGFDFSLLRSLKQVFVSGEALKPEHVSDFGDAIFAHCNTRLINLYGPTEATVDVSYHECDFSKNYQNVPIGEPIDNTSLLVLDANHKLVPVGVPGELYLAGVGLARGYFNNKSLTEERFIANPFQHGQKMYKSGDLACWLPNGEIAYLGRIDNQVKVRGHRIELGEIEVTLAQYDHLHEVAVVTRGGDDYNYLVAYYTGAKEVSAEQLTNHLSAELPAYMIPKFFVHLSEMPLTRNGKLDRKALPEPTLSVEEEEDLLPTSSIEKQLAGIWSEVLKLGNSDIGVNRNFFSIGGDSIRAIRLLSAINLGFKRKLELVDLFENATIKTQAELIERPSPSHNNYEVVQSVERDMKRLEEHVLHHARQTNDIQGVYAMSDIEMGMFFHSFLETEVPVYHDQFVYNIPWSDFNLGLLQHTVELLIQKHPILRTSFDMNTYDEPVSLVHKQITPVIDYEDLKGWDKSDQELHIKHQMEQDRQIPFDHQTPPLWRMKVYRTSASNVSLLLIFHHAILDGWSVASLVTELNNTYLALIDNPTYAPAPLNLNYRDYVVQELTVKQSEEVKSYWQNTLDDFTKMEIRDFYPEQEGANGIGQMRRELNANLRNELIDFSRKNNISIKEICLAAYAHSLKALTNNKQLLFGLVSNNRLAIEDGDKVLGCFLNTIPFRLDIPGQISTRDFLQLVQDKTLELRRYQQLSFFEIQNLIGKSGSGENALFDTIFNYVDFHVYEDVVYQEEEIDQSDGPEVQSYEKTNTDIDFTVSTFNGALKISAAYTRAKYNKKYIERFFNFFEKSIGLLIKEQKQTLSVSDLIDKQEKRQLVVDINQTVTTYGRDKSLIDLFDQQVAKTPDNIALRHGERCVTYSNLQVLSAKFCNYLHQGFKVKEGSLVGVMLGRNENFIPAILGILRAGGTYVPIDPEYPAERISGIISDSGLSTIIIDSAHQALEGKEGLTIVELESQIAEIEMMSVETPCLTIDSSSTAYIIYTSGSTGKPKGTLITHYNISRVVKNTNYISIDSSDKIIQLSNTAFDGSVFDIYGAILNGAELITVPQETLSDIRGLGQLIETQKVSVMFITTALFNMLAEYSLEYLGGMRKILFGGERISIPHTQKALEYLGEDKLVHVYGPTESTVFASYYPINKIDHKLGTVPIGFPIANTQMYILDEYLNILPKGAAGELCIGGDGLSKGYLNRESLTQEKFVNHPFELGQQLYRTGDLGRVIADGSIEFIGRIDDQVKVRGFRIELGEIESQLQTHEVIQENRVLVLDNNADKHLVAYYVASEDLSTEEIKGHLSASLPDYMIPSYFVKMDNLPLNANGKLDKRALPEVTISEEEYVAPTNKVQKQLVEIWADVLKIDKAKIGINANFFEIGGHSINIIKLNNKVNTHFESDISVANMFRLPTIALMADQLEHGDTRVEEMAQEIDDAILEAEDTLSILGELDD